MLIKEYRVPLPLTVEEYRIAQLYMIAKKSREESHGEGSGVEIIINEPYTDGPGGSGQYTKKNYHVGNHLPGWIKSLLPKSALTVEEEAWNAYPYTRTRYTCPFIEKFSLDIETYYHPDNGYQENVFHLSNSELRSRIVDVIDIVKDQLIGVDYLKDEDPKLFASEKTGRGPLSDNWLEEYWQEVKGKTQPTSSNMSLMCAYKICRVEFRYWGMQTKLEKFIHDVALRKTMLRAHRQAWAWQDEWCGLTIEDIREIEKQTQLALARKMGDGNWQSEVEDDEEEPNTFSEGSNESLLELTPINIKVLPKLTKDPPTEQGSPPNSKDEQVDANNSNDRSHSLSLHKTQINHLSKFNELHSPKESQHSYDLQVANSRMERLEVDSKSNSDEEFFDCMDNNEGNFLTKWSSLDFLTENVENKDIPSNVNNENDCIFNQDFLITAASKPETKRHIHSSSSMENSELISTPQTPETPSCSITVLILVMHSGCVLDVFSEAAAKKSDVATFRGVFESVLRQHYPSLWSHIIIKLVHCPPLCTEALGILSNLSPYSFDISPSTSDMPNIADVPIGAISLLAVLPPDYRDSINKTIMAANEVYHDFLKSKEGAGFAGQIVLLADSMGSLLAYEALCMNNLSTNLDAKEQLNDPALLLPTPRADTKVNAFDFEVSDLFMFGSPLSMVLAAKKLKDPKIVVQRPKCNQIYNMFHPTDPVSSRLEPLLNARFSILPPVNVPRYAKYPLGNGQSFYLSEVVQSLPQHFNDSNSVFIPRCVSDTSAHSVSLHTMETVLQSTVNSLQSKWWGLKRLDYALYCPEGLSNFPSNALPHLFHASYWESPDVIAFILREIGKLENITTDSPDVNTPSNFKLENQREKWIRKRTSVKLKNVAANHRANDIIVLDGREKCLSARFMYGPLDMITLQGEKVDIYIMEDPPEWNFLSTEITDKNGRIIYRMPEKLNYGIYSIKMIVRGDQTSVDFNLAVVPSHTECVVFSIDGSFTASMSVTGRDPKVRAGAVDVCRHWQELGYLLIYVTGRPDMQKHRVVSWLNQHNFPHGLFSFADGLSTDPLGHKTAYLNNLIQKHDICITAAYGSSKDINVYANVGLRSDQIFIVGKVSKKLQIGATVLNDGYAAHLANLQAVGGSRPAKGNARMVIPRSSLNLLSQNMSYRCRSNDNGLCSAVHSGFLKRKSYYLPKKK